MQNRYILTALFKAKQEISSPLRDKLNKAYGSKYASLDAVLNSCEEALSKHGVYLKFTNEEGTEGKYWLVCEAIHVESGEREVSRYLMLLEASTNQKVAAANTYGKRGCISNLLSLATEDDDDGNTCSLTEEQWASLKKRLTKEPALEQVIVKGYQNINPKIRTLKDIPRTEFEKIQSRLDKREAEVAV